MPIAYFFIKILSKLRIIKDTEKATDRINDSIANFNSQFKFMKEEKSLVIQMFIISIFQCLSYYSITYMVYRAFGNSGISIWEIIPAQAFLLLIMTFFPTPGAGLGAEGGFLLIFDAIFKEGTINMSILFWRLYTFYAPIIIGTLFLIPYHKEKRLHK